MCLEYVNVNYKHIDDNVTIAEYASTGIELY